MLQPSQKREPTGFLAFILHAHLPYVRHHDRDDAMEERWFYEAMTETYLPLLEVFDRLTNDGVDFRLTFTLTPTLLSLCADPLMQDRYEAHLGRLIELADKERTRLAKDAALAPLARMYAERFRALRALFLSCGRNIVTRFRHYVELGKLEVMTCAATHGFLPLMKTEEALRAQLACGIREYERHMGRPPRGIWLPECGFAPGIDRLLKELGIDYFIGDTTAILNATPHPNRGVYAPLLTPYGVSVFARDPESSEQVWSAERGYPGDYDYREYYRDIGWDLGWHDLKEWEHIRPYVLPDHERVNTGIKYYRITGKGTHREPYRPEWARAKAAEHAGNFLFNRQRQAEYQASRLDRPPLTVSPYDAELFGHWWYEGPIFIEMLCRKLHYDQQELKLVTPSEYLAEYPVADTGKPAASSWGRSGSAEVWLQGGNDWIYRHLHEAEQRMIRLATRHAQLADERASGSLLRRALNQAARELLLAQSSDWAFIMDSRTVVDYACRRTKDHLGCFAQLCDQIEAQRLDERFVRELEEKDNCPASADYRDYVSVYPVSPVPLLADAPLWQRLLDETGHKPNVVMLAWEYPPKLVGGLSRAVQELAEALAAAGELVHVVTSSVYGAPAFERVNGVYVHRVPVMHSGDTELYHWTFEMNVAMVDHLVRYKESGGRIDVLHAHDWMVYHAARELKYSYGLPLVCTIHATEWGRCGGKLPTPLSERIHKLEGRLVHDADQVFVCSDYMKREVRQLFGIPDDRIAVVPNGVRLPDAPPSPMPSEAAKRRFGAEGRQVVLYVGRLVFEKGVQTLLWAMRSLVDAAPDAVLLIAGSGPMEAEWKRLAEPLGERVRFLGFVDDDTKAALYEAADVCVVPSHYEPFGLVALEAMRQRRPVVLSDTGGLAELIEHGADGYKALPGHVDSLAFHLGDLLRQPQLGRQMAERAYARLREHYDWTRIAAEAARHYRRWTHERMPLMAGAKL